MKHLALILTLLGFTIMGFSATVVVDLAGGGDFTNIHDAVDFASDGDTVLVMSGTFIIGTEDGAITVDKELHLLGSGYDLPADGGTTIQSATGVFVFDGSADGSTLRGFRIYGAATNMINISADDMIIEENHITNSTGGTGMLFNASVTADTVRNNIIGNTVGAGWFTTLVLSTTTDITISNNIFFNGAYAGSINHTSTTNTLIANNVFLSSYTGIASSSGSATITNNIFMNGGVGGQIQGAATNSYNCFYNNANNGTTGIEPILDNPDFVDFGDNDTYDYLSIDEDGYDFHLQAASPGIDAGNPLFDYFDLDGSRNDLGVYGWKWPIGTTGAPTIPVVNSISVTPSTVSPSGTITIQATGRIGE